MIISIFTREIKITCIYKYILLQQELIELGANLKIFVVSEFYKELQNVVQKFKDIPEYSHYCSLINSLDIIPCDYNDHLSRTRLVRSPIMKSGILDSDIVLLSIDRRLMISIPPVKELINKTICCKFRACNDLRYHRDLVLGEPIGLWIPSENYDNHISIPAGSKISHVSPFEICDIPNSLLTLNDDFIRNKYSLDPNKKTLLYYVSPWASDKSNTQEELILNRLLKGDVSEKYNILLAQKSYSSFSLKEHDKFNIDFFDHDYLMRNEVSYIVGGISTAIRESLINEIPVLSIYEDQYEILAKRKVIKSLKCHLSGRFRKDISMFDQFEGIESNLSSDWIANLEELQDKIYNYSEKKKMWFGNKSLLNKLKETIFYNI